MHDAARVRIRHGLADLLEDGQEPAPFALRVLAFLEQCGKRPSADKLHGEEGAAIRADAELVDGHDAGVLQLAFDLRLLEEPFDYVGAIPVLLSEELEGDVPAEVVIAGPVDDADAALTELLLDFVPAADGGRARRPTWSPAFIVPQVQHRIDADASLDGGTDTLVRVLRPEGRTEGPLHTLPFVRRDLHVVVCHGGLPVPVPGPHESPVSTLGNQGEDLPAGLLDGLRRSGAVEGHHVV